jgi:chloramphenicol-sensitive protein RarD
VNHKLSGAGASEPGSRGGAANQTRGIVLAGSSYLIWGFLPLLFAALAPAGAAEIIGQRVLWSAVWCLAILAACGRLRDLAVLARDRQALVGISLCAALLGVNWFAHVAGIMTGRVVEAGIGYLLNPLVSVLLGVWALHESLRPVQWLGVGLAIIAVGLAGAGYGRFPWVAIILPLSWSAYSLVKKRLRLPVGVMAAFTAEMVMLVPLAGALLIALGASPLGTSSLGGPSGLRTVLTIATGLATAVPLLAFNSAARMTKLATLGMLQYLSASCQILLGALYFGEPMPPARLAALVLVIAALAVFTVGGLGATRKPSPATRQIGVAHVR